MDSWWSDLASSARFALALPGFLKRRYTIDEAQEAFRARLAARESNFLALVQRAVFESRANPYRELFRLAGCAAGDVAQLVHAHGLDGSLERLAASGIYLTFEEFKGRVPIVRHGREIPASPGAFVSRRGLSAQTSGSTGRPTRVPIDLDHLSVRATQMMVAYQAHGLLDAPVGIWRGVLPDATGLNNVLRAAQMGQIPLRWFTPQLIGARTSLTNRVANHLVLSIVRLAGVAVPQPEPVALDDAVRIARWAAETVAERGACLLRAHVSLQVRIAVAARAAGISLAGVTMMGGGEPPTPAKVGHMIAAGARWIPTYVSIDVGQIGAGCGQPDGVNDVHVYEDAIAVVQRPQSVPGTALTVPAFCFTTLLATSPQILINAESDDYGMLERRSCGCPLEAAGLSLHLRDIRSYRKLTGEGMTLVGSDMVDILERVLPARFGGSPLDYQISEDEDADGRTRLTLIVHPNIAESNSQAFIDAVCHALRHGGAAASLAGATWSTAGSWQVRRAVPAATAGGKLMPLHFGRPRPS